MRHSHQTKQQKALSNQMRVSCRRLRRDFEALGMMPRETSGTLTGTASGVGYVFSQNPQDAQNAVQSLMDRGHVGVSFEPFRGGVHMRADGFDVTVRGF